MNDDLPTEPPAMPDRDTMPDLSQVALTELQVAMLRAIADADDHFERHTVAVFERMDDLASQTGLLRELGTLEDLELVDTDLCSCDETTAHALTDVGMAVLWREST